jgi:hypothetical protein
MILEAYRVIVLRGELLRRNPAVRAKHFLRHIKLLKASAYRGGQELLTATPVVNYLFSREEGIY